MVGIVVISHGDMAKGVLSAAAMLSPGSRQLVSLSLYPEDNPDEYQQKLEGKIREVDSGDGVVILADMLGGTPCNRAMYSLGEKTRMLTGLSLPMLCSLLAIREEGTDRDIVSIVKEVMAEAKEGMVDVNELTEKD
jgi:mannose/fructose-specific phosphotransferase system component IIA